MSTPPDLHLDVNTSTDGEDDVKIIRCDTCRLDYDQAAYDVHLNRPCDYGIHPMLACNLHGEDCPYNNPVWRHEQGRTWSDKDRACRPLYQYRSHQFGSTIQKWFALYEPEPKPKPKAPRPHAAKAALAEARHTTTEEETDG